MSQITKSKTAAIIAEYNPFHNGHAFHISRAKEVTGAENVVVIMSGNFVQRGDCAIVDKFSRTRMALAGGADLVLELPLPFACAGAEKFALGGVTIADALGGVDCLAFGMECGDTRHLINAANAVDDERLRSALDKHLSEGKLFAAARTEAVRELYGDDAAEILCSPNNTLAVEYIRALKRLNSDIIPVGISREGAEHNSVETSGRFASATAIRRMLINGENDSSAKFMPDTSVEILHRCAANGTAPADLKTCERAILARLRGMTREQLARLPDISEGLENRIYDCARTASSLAELYDSIKSKRYSHARIRRIILSAFIGIRETHTQSVPYIRILGMNGQGRELLSRAKPSLPLISSYKHVQKLPQEARSIYMLECYADDMWALMTPKIQPCGSDMSEKLIVI